MSDPNKVQTITETLHETSDRVLKKEIEDAAKPLDYLLRDGRRHEIDFGGVKVSWFQCLEALKTRAFDMNQVQRRNQAVDTFLMQFEEFKRSLDEMRARE